MSLIACWGTAALAQVAPAPAAPGEPAGSETPTIWNHFWVSGQANFIGQLHDSFNAQYSGPNSFRDTSEYGVSRVLTLYLGVQPSKNWEFLLDVESGGGPALSRTSGLAGFTDVDSVRDPTLDSTPYIARAIAHYVLPLSGQSGQATRNPLSLFTKLPARRLEFRLGKMSPVDFFDLNGVGTDSHTQFMNWAAVNNAAYDYPADPRGYTYGLYLEYDDSWGSIRLGEMLMQKASGPIDWDLKRSGSTDFEADWTPVVWKDKPTTVRYLTYWNRADMGNYREAVNGFLNGQTATPDVTAYREQGRNKVGLEVNAEQQINSQLEVYGRLGWTDGKNEDFSYTEVDRAASVGALLTGKWWRRPNDKLGEAFLLNGISGDHSRYLQLGGLGFVLGDGGLSYASERINETFYTAQVWNGISLAVDWQHVTNPGYNQARGPVSVIAFRLHMEGGLPFDKIGASFH